MPKQLFDSVFGTNWSVKVNNLFEFVNKQRLAVYRDVVSRVTPYKAEVSTRVVAVREFGKDRIRELRASDSFLNLIKIIMGIVVSVVHVIIEVLVSVRDWVYRLYQARYDQARNKVTVLVDQVKIKAIELPNTPVGRKVESVSKRFLGETRYDQTVEFIKSEVFPRVYMGYEKVLVKSPSPSEESSTTVESSACSPQSNTVHQGKQRKALKKK